MPNDPAIEQELTTVELLKTTLAEAQELVSAEMALAKRELAENGRDALITFVAVGVAAALGVIGLTLLLIGTLLAVGGTLVQSFSAGGLLFSVAAAFALIVGAKHAPRRPLERTKRRLTGDAQSLRGLLDE